MQSNALRTRIASFAALAAAAVLVVTGCAPASEEPGETTPPATSDRFNQDLHDALPEAIRESGTIGVVIPGANPPWWILEGDGEYTGAASDLMLALGDVLGVEIELATNPDISAAIASIASGRYQMAFAPYGDQSGQPTARPGVDFVDVVQEIVPFLVPEGNPKIITQLEYLCGVKVAAQTNGRAYVLLQEQAEKCAEAGEPELEVIGQTGVPNGVLAVQSGRADAFFSSGAPLIYYAETSDTPLEVVGTDSDNGFAQLFQGIVLPDDSELTPIILEAMQILFDDGTYEEIMTAHGLERQMIDAPGINLDKENAQ